MNLEKLRRMHNPRQYFKRQILNLWMNWEKLCSNLALLLKIS